MLDQPLFAIANQSHPSPRIGPQLESILVFAHSKRFLAAFHDRRDFLPDTLHINRALVVNFSTRLISQSTITTA
jgi:hypothetical protein